MTNDIVQHLEGHLGKVARGWGDAGKIQVVQFPDQPQKGVVTYATLGLSSTPLPMNQGRVVRQELLVSVNSSFESKSVASFLLTFAEYVRAQNRALLRGDVVGPSGPLIPGVRASAVYASLPVFFEDDFATYRESSPPTVLVWLIPLLPEDAEFVNTHGWEAFEDKLESAAVDFWDLNRPPVQG
jgi:hypothetical protein